MYTFISTTLPCLMKIRYLQTNLKTNFWFNSLAVTLHIQNQYLQLQDNKYDIFCRNSRFPYNKDNEKVIRESFECLHVPSDFHNWTV